MTRHMGTLGSVMGSVMASPVAPEHRTPSHVTSALVRFGGWLSDQGWVVAVDDMTLDAERHPGVRYRSLSPIGRMTRGALACRFDGGRFHLRYRPNWLAALFDVGLLALGYAITRKLGLPLHGSRWADAGVAFVILALVLPAVMLWSAFGSWSCWDVPSGRPTTRGTGFDTAASSGRSRGPSAAALPWPSGSSCDISYRFCITSWLAI